jgi:hypothetical protein
MQINISMKVKLDGKCSGATPTPRSRGREARQLDRLMIERRSAARHDTHRVRHDFPSATRDSAALGSAPDPATSQGGRCNGLWSNVSGPQAERKSRARERCSLRRCNIIAKQVVAAHYRRIGHQVTESKILLTLIRLKPLL